MKKITFMIFAFLSATIGFAKGSKNFDNAIFTASYANVSFIGNDDITWTYLQSRSEGDFSVDTREAFSGSNQRSLEL